MVAAAAHLPPHLLLLSFLLALASSAVSAAAATSPAIDVRPRPLAAAFSIGHGGLGRRRGVGGSRPPRLHPLPSPPPPLPLPVPSWRRITPLGPVASSLLLVTMSSSSPTPTSTVEGDDDDYSLSRVQSCSDAARSCFRDKSVLLTGASGGLGRALALLLCRDCSPRRLVLSGRDGTRVEAVADECRRAMEHSSENGGAGADTGGGEVVDTKLQVIPCDLSSMDDVKNLAAGALAGGSIDVLVNNGGMSSRSTFLETSAEVDELVMRVNFLSGAALAKAVVPGMMKANGGRGGAVVWISSVQGLVGIPNRSSYAASKFAVQGYCESLRAELAPEGVNVCVVSPGYIRTNLSRSAVLGDGSRYGRMDPTTEGGADPFDVARTVLDSVASGRSDVIVAAGLSARAAIWLRFFVPSVLERLLVSRYEKSRREGQLEDEEK